MRTVLSLPTLYSISSKDKVKQWSIEVVEDNGEYFMKSSHGYQGQTITPNLSSAIIGKNIGKKNETSTKDQAILEARAKWKKKTEENYTEAVPTSKDGFENLRPMLAHKWEQRKHNIVYPFVVQPKFNGIRSLAVKSSDGTSVSFTSRGDKTFTTLGHIEKALLEIGFPVDLPLDGELFTSALTFQGIVSAVKKQRPQSELLEFWVFDLAMPELEYSKRLQLLLQWKKRIPENSPIKICPSYPVKNEEEFLIKHKEFSLEHEGSMARNLKGKYVFDYRSSDLLKHKDFIDEEFEIIGGDEGSGADEGTVIFRCKTSTGKEFSVRPRGSREQRAEWFANLASLIGKMLTVRYQNLSDDGVPIFPVGITIRDYE